MYLCGPTVYKPSHIGHMVGPVIFDAIKRYLSYLGYKVTWVVNITDVDDKLIKESNEKKKTMEALADEMTADYMQNLSALGVDTIDHFPKATDNIGEIISLTQSLIDKGYAYASEGDVYFDVAKDPGYGKLSRRTTESLQGEGGDMAERKRSPGDFALWKSAKPGEPFWDSPWGKGRPGWHIECSAMSRRILGETFDIHGGGLDLIFPHHENEIAQSECAHGKPQAKYWLHNGLMQAASEAGKVGGRNTRAADAAAQEAGDLTSQQGGKISKSTGASAFRDLLKRHRPETIRFFLLSTHYRSPIQYSEELLQETAKSLEGFYGFFQRYEQICGQPFFGIQPALARRDGGFDPANDALLNEVAALRQRFIEAMDDDFNTGAATASLFELLRSLNKFVDNEKLQTGTADATKVTLLKRGSAVLRELAAVLGLFNKPSKVVDAAVVQELDLKQSATGSITFGPKTELGKAIDLLSEVRSRSRKNKDFATADLIRNNLQSMGFVLKDGPDKTEASLPFEVFGQFSRDDILAKLVQLLVDVRAAVARKGDTDTVELIFNRLSEIGITLEDRPGGTEWHRS